MLLGSSDYGSLSSASSSRGSVDWAVELDQLNFHLKSMKMEELPPAPQRATSYADLPGKMKLDDVMSEFRLNGSDSPYEPQEDLWSNPVEPCVSRAGPPRRWLRQCSWPEPRATPYAPLPSTLQHTPRAPPLNTPEHTHRESPIDEDLDISPALEITAEQLHVLQSVPQTVLRALLRAAVKHEPRPVECRFCKNNGEREAYYRSHRLKDARGRVQCPVLRAFACRRCGARGDYAHTIKYCPLSSEQERNQSAAMMRSVRLASGRRRTPSDRALSQPLHPEWAALEQKLSM